MTYSVWDPIATAYDYYVTPQGTQLENDVPKPTQLNGGAQIGVTPEQAAWPLPANAKKVGRGKTAKGMIARRPGALALGDAPSSNPALGIILGIGVLFYFMFWPTRPSK